MRLYYRSQKRICIEKEKEKSIVKNEKRESLEVFERLVEKEIYLTIEITINITNILCTKERQRKEDDVRLLIFKQLDN